jgi:hypothetical protein
MRARDVEVWARRVLQIIAHGSPFEDAHVELKRELVPGEKCARRLAGHANAANGEMILWLFGVDQAKGIVGLQTTEHANWHSELTAKFDTHVPDCVSVVVDWDGKSVLAMAFETGLAPYVVFNATRASSEDGPAEREVPIRTATRTQSASRDQLMRLLLPVAILPSIEVFRASLTPQAMNQTQRLWEFFFEGLILPGSRETVVLPVQKCPSTFDVAGIFERQDALQVTIAPGADQHGPAFYATLKELVATRPGVFRYKACCEGPRPPEDVASTADVTTSLAPAGASGLLLLRTRLEWRPENGSYQMKSCSVQRSLNAA